MLIRVSKIFNCTSSCLLKYFCQCGLRTNFKHSCDQVTFSVTFSMVLSKNYHNSDGSCSHQNVISYRRSYTKNKNENTKYHSILISFKSQVYSRQGSPISLLFGTRSLVSYLHVWVKSAM